MPSSFLRQLSGGEAWRSSSKRWANKNIAESYYHHSTSVEQSGWCSNLMEMEGVNWYENGGFVIKKRVMVVVDQSSHSKHAMMWALTHAVNKGDLLTLLHIVPPTGVPASDSYSSTYLASSLGSLCKACKPEVEVEALVIQGPKLATVMSQVKKLEVSVLVLGQKSPSSLLNCFCGTSSSEDFVEDCISSVECLTVGVRKQSKGMGGYLISTKWQKNFWLLA